MCGGSCGRFTLHEKQTIAEQDSWINFGPVIFNFVTDLINMQDWSLSKFFPNRFLKFLGLLLGTEWGSQLTVTTTKLTAFDLVWFGSLQATNEHHILNSEFRSQELKISTTIFNFLNLDFGIQTTI